MFVFLAKSKSISSATVCDLTGKFCFKMDAAIKGLKSTKITTACTRLYEDYAEHLLTLYGVCPLIVKGKEAKPHFVLKTKRGKEITLGGFGFRSEIGSADCPDALLLCPKPCLAEEFFTLFALFGKFEPLLSALPKRLNLNGKSFSVDSIF